MIPNVAETQMRGCNDVRVFAGRILRVINRSKNIKKGHWSTVEQKKLLELLKQEVAEVEELLNSPTANPEDLTDECADVAAFAMFIASNAGGLRK